MCRHCKARMKKKVKVEEAPLPDQISSCFGSLGTLNILKEQDCTQTAFVADVLEWKVLTLSHNCRTTATRTTPLKRRSVVWPWKPKVFLTKIFMEEKQTPNLGESSKVKDEIKSKNETASKPLHSAQLLLWGDNDASSNRHSNLDLLRDHTL